MELKYYAIIHLSFFLELIYCSVFYTISFKKNKNFIQYLVIHCLLSTALIFLLSFLRYNFDFIITKIFIPFLFIFYLYFIMTTIFKEPSSKLILTLCTAIATQCIVGRVYETILLVFQKDPYNSIGILHNNNFPHSINWLFYYFIHILLAYIIAKLFKGQTVLTDKKIYKTSNIILTTIITVALILTTRLSRNFEGTQTIIDILFRSFSLISAILILILRLGLFERGKILWELQLMEDLFNNEKMQFEQLQNEINFINMKYHDFKSQITSLDSKLTNEELMALKSAVALYDSKINTGNKILDAIIYKKQFYLQSNNIKIDYSVSDNISKVIDNIHLYSILSNGIDNAIEAVTKIDEVHNRVISLNIDMKNGLHHIEISNYFKESINYNTTTNFPKTQKSNVNRHGFGLKSIQYIVNMYKGSLKIDVLNNIFHMDILFFE